MYTKITNNMKVSVAPLYLRDQSDPEDNHYVWAYTIFIENQSDQTVQLINRHWEVTDAIGQTQIVEGIGVVGEQPILKSGEGFEYTSGTVLPTPSGLMVGSYEMEDCGSKSRFNVEIPAFSLDSPFQIVRPN
jgi:ApaG protein